MPPKGTSPSLSQRYASQGNKSQHSKSEIRLTGEQVLTLRDKPHRGTKVLQLVRDMPHRGTSPSTQSEIYPTEEQVPALKVRDMPHRGTSPSTQFMQTKLRTHRVQKDKHESSENLESFNQLIMCNVEIGAT
ncbi:hypothetical protein BsWGS_24076 [Bradybaena similaris]